MMSIPFRRPFAAVLVLVLATVLHLPSAGALDATFSGRVFGGDGATPRSGVTVNLVQGDGESVFSSRATGADGTFVIEKAPAGSYTLLVEAPEGAFLAAENLELQPGANKPLALALSAAGEPSGLGSATQTKPWLKWLIIGLLGVSGLYVIDEITNGEDPSSNF